MVAVSVVRFAVLNAESRQNEQLFRIFMLLARERAIKLSAAGRQSERRHHARISRRLHSGIEMERW